jgi:activator of HSP90 ATPase
MTDRSRPGTYTAVSTNVAGTTADVHRSAAHNIVTLDLSAHLTGHEGIACWSAAVRAPAASDLLALLVPVVDRLRELAADELLGAEVAVTPPGVAG